MNTLYFVGYYDEKVTETIDGYIGASTGMFKDTASFILGAIPLSEGISKIASKVGATKIGKKIIDAIPMKDTISAKYRIVKLFLHTEAFAHYKS